MAFSKQRAALAALDLDLLCLQEVTLATDPLWRDGAPTLGLDHVASSTDWLGLGRYANLLASRWPIEPLDLRGAGLPCPEKLLSVIVKAPGGPLEVHVAHLPPGVSRPQEKVATFEAIYSALSQPAHRPRILCGDFNSPRSETKDGNLVTWAGRHKHARAVGRS
jgi:endonuclease/exonuclease/phosphatase family metal-dependent hydrolase